MCSFIISSNSSNIKFTDGYKNAMDFVKTLILSEIDSVNGVKITVDAPTGNNPMLSIARPAVIRQEYGKDLNLHSQDSKFSDRYFYGQIDSKSGYSQVGTLQQDQYTRPMVKEMQQLGCDLLKIVKNSSEFKFIKSQRMRKKSRILFREPNHVSILVYFGLTGFKEASTMSFHCDNTYSPSGKFSTRMNTQLEDTPTITLTLGSPRVLKFQRRFVGDKGTWEIDPSFTHHETLSHGTVSIVHPDDERPFEMKIGGKTRKVQYQHGNIRVGKNQMSIALVFRHVTTHCKFDRASNKRLFEMSPTQQDEIDHKNLHQNAKKKEFQMGLHKLYKDVMKNK